MPRIYQNTRLIAGQEYELDSAASHHLGRVLRAKLGDRLTIFNGDAGEFEAVISFIDKKKVIVTLQEFIDRTAESPISLCLAQGISRGEKMDYTIQKAVELGVTEIIPLLTERCTVKLDTERREKRLEHWQSIIVSACEQSGRNILPKIALPQTLTKWLPEVKSDQNFVLAPQASERLNKISLKNNSTITLLVGPEGGLSDQEIKIVTAYNFLPLNLGPRILRTETAAVAALTVLQCFYGDMA